MSVLTTLEKIKEEQRKIAKQHISGFDNTPLVKTIKQEVNELEQIRMVIQSLVDKVHSMDRFIRENLHNNTRGNLYNSTVQKEEIKEIDSNLPVFHKR